ncbi:MAG: tetratricopeptide repeat protein [Caldilineaceae bacterium]
MAHLTLSLLGPFHALLDDKPITTFRSVKNQALLAWLALESKRPVSRASVAGLCWPEESEETARLNLRQALFQLRSVLHATDEEQELNHLLITAQTLQFNFASSYTIDVVAFNELFEACARHTHPSLDHCAECSSRLMQATTLYRGEFLQGMFVNDSESLEEWMLWRRQQFQQHQLLALHALASWFEQQADYKQAQSYAQRQLDIDSLREDAYQQMMRSLALDGKRQEALVYFERCRQVLQDELGVPPSTATQKLYEQIKGQTFPQPSVASNVTLPELPAANRHNLPTAPNRLVGRQTELQFVQQRLMESDCRLVTILGPGGVGKTRFALALATQILDWGLRIADSGDLDGSSRFPDGVWFTPLAGVSNTLQLPQAIAASLGVRLEGQSTPRQGLLDYLHSKQLLLVLDNYEHLMSDALLVDEILQNANGVKIVVTSRERLNFQKEWVYELSGLPFPAPQRSRQPLTNGAAANEGDPPGAVQLFLDRAHRFSHFHATSTNLAAIQRICQLVEGYPLGIELAAALIGMMPLPDIVQEIESGIDILATTMRDLPDRHRSLRAVFDSSWESLRPQERAVMARLSVFRGGFDWRAAQSVAKSSRLDLAGLLNKSMLSLTPAGRYEVHELLRQYAWARLEDRNEVQQAHARYFANFVETRKAQLRGEAQKQTSSEFDNEIENLRLAWAWAIQQADDALLGQFYRGLALYFETRGLYEEAESGFANATAALRQGSADSLVLVQLLVQQGSFCRLRSQYDEAKKALLCALSLLDQQSQESCTEIRAQQAEALSNLGLITHFLGDNRSASQQLERAVAISRELDRPDLLAECLAFSALFTQFNGKQSEARQLFQESLAIRRSLHDLRGMALTMNQLGFLFVNSADYTRAEMMFQECLTIQRDLGDQLGVANTLNSLGAGAITWGDYPAAKRYHSESLAIYRQYNERGGILRNLGNLGYVYNRLGEYEAALEILLQALAMDREIGSPRSIVITLRHLGESYLHLGDLTQSRRHYHQALVMAQDIEEIPLVLLVLNAMAPLWLREGQLLETVARLSFILNHPATEGKVLKQAERRLEELKNTVDEKQIGIAIANGKQMQLEQVVEDVLRGT